MGRELGDELFRVSITDRSPLDGPAAVSGEIPILRTEPRQDFAFRAETHPGTHLTPRCDGARFEPGLPLAEHLPGCGFDENETGLRGDDGDLLAVGATANFPGIIGNDGWRADHTATLPVPARDPSLAPALRVGELHRALRAREHEGSPIRGERRAQDHSAGSQRRTGRLFRGHVIDTNRRAPAEPAARRRLGGHDVHPG